VEPLSNAKARVIRRFLHRRRIAFACTNTLAITVSIAMFTCALAAGAPAYAATLLRLALAVPILYVGYSRYMLVDTLTADRRLFGRTHAEVRMLARVAGAIGTSVVLKLLVEPVLTTWITAHANHAATTLAPIAGDLVYGPLATYVLLGILARRPSSPTPRRASRLQAGTQIACE